MQRALILVVAAAVLVAAVVFLLNRGDASGPGVLLPDGAETVDVAPDARQAAGDSAPEDRRDVSDVGVVEAPAPSPRAGDAALVVEVRYRADRAPAADVEVIASRDEVGRAWVTRRTARTDEAGVARFAALAAGPWTVAAAIGARSARVTIVAGRTAEVVLELADGVDVVGAVVDPDGRPVPAAVLWLSEPWNDARGGVAARAGADGRFALRGVHRGQVVAAWADGFAASPVFPLRVDSGEQTLQIVLAPVTGGVAGRVVDDAGRPVRGATVLVGADERPFDRRAEDGSRIRGPAPREARTDADGKFEVAHLEPGAVPLQVAASGSAPFAGEIVVRVGEVGETLVTLHAGAVVEGTCRDGTGAVRAGVAVATVGAPSLAERRAESGADGTYRLSDVAVGDIEVGASITAGADPAVTRELTTAPGATVRWDPVVDVTVADPRELVSGRVVGVDGRGRGGYLVVAEPDPRQRADPVSGIVADDGAFRLAVPWPVVRLLAFPLVGRREFPVAFAGGIARGTSDVQLSVDEQAFSGLRARIVDPVGAPVEATLQVWHETARVWREVASDPATGVVSIEPMPAGTCTLEVRSAENPWLRLGERELPAGRVLDLGDLVMQAGGRVEGSVTFVDGGTPSALTLRFVDEAAGREVGVAEVRDGRYRSNPLPLANLVMVVEGDGVAATRVPTPLDATTRLRVIDLSVTRGVPVTLRLVVPAGVERPAFVSVGIFREREAVWTRGIGRSAALEVAVSLAPGSYRALAQAEKPLADVAFEVGGQPITVDLPLGGR